MPGMPGGLITNNKTALIYIENFRPMFTRVPRGRGLGMTKSSFIALEVGSFGLMGSLNAEIWGSPRDITSDPLVLEWCKGLSDGGGGGYVSMNCGQPPTSSYASAETFSKFVRMLGRKHVLKLQGNQFLRR